VRSAPPGTANLRDHSLLTNRPPLVVDLDGTLIKTDLLVDKASQPLVDHCRHFIKLPIWLAEGKNALKSHLAKTTIVDADSVWRTAAKVHVESQFAK